MKRPSLNDKISVSDFQNFYWLKSELIAFCRAQRINQTGGKLEIEKRIITFLNTGTIKNEQKIQKTSKFDWQHTPLTLDTIITDNYKNTAHVRLFFSKQIGPHFRFNVPFIEWMKTNIGQTLQDAITQWHNIKALEKSTNYKREIAPQFEYNKYMRDFLSDNPDKSKKDAIHFWKLKRSKAGNNQYTRADLQLTSFSDNP